MKDDPFSLNALEDIIVPTANTWFPLAEGWKYVVVLVLVWLTLVAVRQLLRYRRNAYRRAGLTLLEQLKSTAPKNTSDWRGQIDNLSAILKRVAMAAYSRELVASLSGADWADFLSRSSHGDLEPSDFESLTRLHLGPSEGSWSQDQFDSLYDVARDWILSHDEEAPEC